MRGWYFTWAVAVALLGPFLILPGPASRAQDLESRREAADAIVIPDTPSCPDCGVTLRPKVQLGTKGPSLGLVCFGARVTPLPDGRFLLGPSCADGELLVFSPDGELEQTFGRYGQGPGELLEVRQVFVRDDGVVYVFDSNRRQTIFSATFEPLQTSVIRGLPTDVVFLPGSDQMIHQYMIFSEGAIGYPLQLVDRNGDVLQSFGSVDRRILPSEVYSRWRRIELASESSLWSAYRNRFEIELWSVPELQLVRRLVRDAPWFEPWRDKSLRNEKPVLNDVRVDEYGLLWVLVGLPDPDFDPSVLGPPGAEEERLTLAYDERWDTRVEVIDPDEGTVLASATHEKHFGAWVGDLLMSRTQDENGDYFMDLWRIDPSDLVRIRERRGEDR